MPVQRSARERQSRSRLRRRPDQPSRGFPDGLLPYLFSKRRVIDGLCDSTTPAYVRDWVVARLVDEAAITDGRRMTKRDRRARIRAWKRAIRDAKRLLRRAWRDPDGRLWRGRPRTWPALVLATWVSERRRAVLRWKLYEPARRKPPRKKRRGPLGPPRRKRGTGARDRHPARSINGS